MARLRAEDERHPAGAGDAVHWAIRADREFSRPGVPDRGLFLVFLLNLTRLAPGDAVFLDAGVVHSYLCGAGIEVMASSDNVVRCGLTGKHVDVHEMVRIANFGAGAAARVVSEPAGDGSSGETVYRTPATEFELRRLELDAESGEALREARGPELLVVLGDDANVRVTIRSGGAEHVLGRGGACLVAGGNRFSVRADRPADLLRVRIPGLVP
jgi:mannose-6-phosphate isomerase class I